MAEKRSLTNFDVYERYVKVFKADADAARHFMADETQLGVTSNAQVHVKRWSNKIRTLRKKWAQLSKARKEEKTKQAFLEYQQQPFHEKESSDPSVLNPTSPPLQPSDMEENSPMDSNHVKSIAPLDQLSHRHSRRKTDAILALVREEAEKQQISSTQLLGYLLHRENYVSDRPVANVGISLFHKESVDKELTLDEALYMLSTYNLGRIGYTSLRHDLKGKVDLPAHYRLMQYKTEVMPEINALCPDSGSGVSLSLIESVKCHFQRLITLLHLQPGRYLMTAKEGLDGSGWHAVYDQLGNVQIHNIIIWMWVPLHLSKNSDQHLHACTSKSTESEIVWKEGAPSSPEAARPILITLGKEDKELLEKIVPPVDEEISKLHSSCLMVEVSGEVFIFEVEFIRSMNDGKMQKLLLGRGGAFCILCPHTQEEAISLQQIKDGFEMGEVEIDELNLLYDDLVDEVGNVVKRRGDYGERLGLTQCPITGVSIKTFPILHALLRGFDFC